MRGKRNAHAARWTGLLLLAGAALWPHAVRAGDAANMTGRVHTSLSVQNSNFGFRAHWGTTAPIRVRHRPRRIVLIPYGYAAPSGEEQRRREPEVIRTSERPRVEYNITIERPARQAAAAPYQLRAATYIAPSGNRARLAELFYQARNYDEAAFNLERLVAANPDVARFRFFYAEALFAQGRYGEAADQIAAGIERDPEFAGSDHNVAKRYRYYEDFEAHLKTLERHVGRNPGEASPVLVLAYVNHFGGVRARAAALFESLLEKSPHRETVKVFLGMKAGTLSSDGTAPILPRASEEPTKRVDL